jgi:adenosine deaminase CECR1
MVDGLFQSNIDSESGLEQCRETLRELVRSEDLTPSDLSEEEKEAAMIVRNILEFERKTLFGNLPSEDGPPPGSLDMGGQFLTNKQRIDEQSKLFQIAKLVPKGALLHLHFNTELDAASVLRKARNAPNMYIRSVRPLLSEEDLRQTELVFSVMADHEVSEGVNIFSPDYVGDRTNWKNPSMAHRVWMKWSRFCDDFDTHFCDFAKMQIVHLPDRGSASAAEAWVLTKLALDAEEVYKPDQTLNGSVFEDDEAERRH